MTTLELLDTNAIRAALTPNTLALLTQLDILPTVDSTNAYLLNKKTISNGYVCLAEQQTAGRGQRDKNWHSPPSNNIYLSLAWYFNSAAQLAGLSLVMGIAVINALVKYGLPYPAIKWPNDILFQQKKLCGILVETQRDVENAYRAIIGIGLNVAMPTENISINQPWIDIATIIQKTPERNLIASYLINELFNTLSHFQTHGLKAFLKEWQQYDVLFNQPITLIQQQQTIEGIAAGIDNAGNLLVEIDGVIKPFFSGEISVRLGTI